MQSTNNSAPLGATTPFSPTHEIGGGWRTTTEALAELSIQAQRVHEQAIAGWKWDRLGTALDLYWGLHDPVHGQEAVEPEERLASRKDLAEAVAAIVAYAYPGDPGTEDEAVLAQKIEDSEALHEIADALRDPWIHALADAVASPAMHALNDFVVKYLRCQPFELVTKGPPSEEAAADLRKATTAVLEAQPGSVFELCRKIRTAALVGLHARLKRDFSQPCAEAGEAYQRFRGHLDRLPNWILGGSFVRYLKPAWMAALDTRPNCDETLILDAIRDAGPGWQASIAADVERLERAGLLARSASKK